MSSHFCEAPRRSASATQQLATLYLDQDVLTFIQHRRTKGIAWRIIARDLYEATDHQVDVTHETIRNWVRNDEVAA